jgi:hypothetical protein
MSNNEESVKVKLTKPNIVLVKDKGSYYEEENMSKSHGNFLTQNK